MRYSSFVERIGGDGSGAWDIHVAATAAKRYGEDVIVMSVGDPDFETPAIVRSAAIKALNDGDTHYTEIEGTPSLRAHIAAYFFSRGGWRAKPENVSVAAGTQNGLLFASMLLLEPGDEVIVPDPCYVTYDATLRASGAIPVRVSPIENSGFRPDIDAIGRAVTSKTRALMITTPNNPTGVVLSREEIAALAQIAKSRGLWVISDEVYSELTFERENISISAMPGMAERTVTISSLSKSHAMTGWRIGWVIGPEEFIRHASNLSLCMLYGLPGFIQAAAVVALQNNDIITAQMRETYLKRRDILFNALQSIPGLQPIRPESGMFLMAHIGDTGLSSREFVKRLYEKTGVSVMDGAAFGLSAQEHVRLSYTTNHEELSEGARRIRVFCQSLV